MIIATVELLNIVTLIANSECLETKDLLCSVRVCVCACVWIVEYGQQLK
jgi:hypothetical protein